MLTLYPRFHDVWRKILKFVETNGAKVPSIGFGTWDLRDKVATDMVTHAIEAGYRHIDTAQRYENEKEVGKGIKQSGLPRSDVFLTTKIWPSHFAPGLFRNAVSERLEWLGVDQLDLLLLHWPSKDHDLQETIELLNEAKDLGQTKHIGVSNFTSSMIEQAAALSRSPIVCNQIEYHPFLSQEALFASCAPRGIAITAYCPIARGQVLNDATIGDIAARHGKSPTQITLRWLVQQDNVIAIPRTSNVDRAKANLDIFDFELTDLDMQSMNRLGQERRRLVNLDIAPDWD